MIIQPQTIEELKEIFVKILLSRTDKVTKVSDGSVLNGIAYGAAKIAQKSLKDISLAQSHFDPSAAFGQYLDNIAVMWGIAPRFGALGSSTYVRVVGTIGTVYTAGIQVFSGSGGVLFDLLTTSTIGNDGFAYLKIQSQTTGLSTNLDALTINAVTPIPLGHEYVINEYTATGGRDIEDDDTFRDRIKNSINQFSRGTLAYLTQVFLKINNNTLRVLNFGSNGEGKIRLGVATQNGADFTPTELTTLASTASEYLSLSELNPDGLPNEIGVVLENISYQPIDISFRIELLSGYNPDSVRIDIQTQMQKILDYRFFVPGTTIQWSDFLQVAKNTEGVKFVPDAYFYPNQDIPTYLDKLPRVRGFLMLDLSGSVLSSGSNSLNPSFYPAVADFSYQTTILANI